MLSASASPIWCIQSNAPREKRSRHDLDQITERLPLTGKLFSIPVLLVALAGTLLSCDRDKDAVQAQGQPRTDTATEGSKPSTPQLTFPPDSGPPPTVDGNRSIEYVKEIVAFGPRPIGSANHKKVEDYITSHLEGDAVEDDRFTADTPEGKFPVHNIIAKVPGTKDGMIVLASHYDTNYPLRNTPYVGAYGGGSSSPLLLELENQLRGKKRDGYRGWLVCRVPKERAKPEPKVHILGNSRI